MTDTGPVRRYRFGTFEADAVTGELRRQGIRIKLNAQPFQVLLMLLERPGEVLTREEIARALWSDGTFVDYDHGVNSAVNRIRDALGDTAGSPRYVETLARRGYRFVAPVESLAQEADSSLSSAPRNVEKEFEETEPGDLQSSIGNGILASPEELPRTSHKVVQALFLLLQFMYLGFYVGALTNLAEIEDLISPLPRATLILYGLIGTAAILIPVRAFVFCSALFRAPGVQRKFLKMWPGLLIADVAWALSPFLLMHHINAGLALACMALLVYAPFAQRSLMLMGAGRKKIDPSGKPAES
ncbi:winged helix-turn-helix domain-containing protein [Telmatobacter sp. DSM 110680]|uniref:Winged helix-turn-helix domain-containing protein n=1 Tax=Telmatobacter sp. DSM 110680 TaxID=3036704 RepID=A0AAU7DR13_9BACT